MENRANHHKRLLIKPTYLFLNPINLKRQYASVYQRKVDGDARTLPLHYGLAIAQSRLLVKLGSMRF
jgi:hypothetical protein